MSTTNDSDLVEASLGGDVQAFARLVERYRYAVFGLCLNYTRDFDAAEDAAQEAFIKAFLKLRNLEAGDRFAPWLRQIAVNECRMGYRRRAEPLTECVEKTLVSPAGTPEDEAIAVEGRRTVLTALGTLSDEQQQLITLFYLEGLSQKEIAAFLDLAPQAVNQRLYRARNQLRKEMLNMVEEILGGRKLPDGFTDEVIRTALGRGRGLLKEQRWTEAKAQFRKVTSTVRENPDAQRGLARALEGEVHAMMRGEVEDIDNKLLQEALAAHEEAFRLGARDEETAWNLAGLYSRLNRRGDRGRVLRVFGESTDDSGKAFRALEQASWSFRLIDDQLAFDLHRKALSIDGIEPKDRLRIYFAAPLVIYFNVGKGDLWLAETEALSAELGLPLSTNHYMYHRDRMALLCKMGRHRKAIETGQVFLRRLESEAVEDPLQRRWWIAHILANSIQSQHESGDEAAVHAEVESARENLVEYEKEWRAAPDDAAEAEYRKFYGYANNNLAGRLRQIGLFDEAIEFLEKALTAGDSGNNYMALACGYMGKNDKTGALEAMRRMHRSPNSDAMKKWIYFGGAKRWFDAAVFDPVRDDPKFAALAQDGISS